jgi:hypothetical protein
LTKVIRYVILESKEGRDMKDTKWIFKTAQLMLTAEELNNWVYFAYGVLENGLDSIEEDGILSIEEQKRGVVTTLLKGITQEVDARKQNQKSCNVCGDDVGNNQLRLCDKCLLTPKTN